MTPLQEGLDSFTAFLALSRGLAKNSVESYGRDISLFMEFLLKKNCLHCEEITRPLVLAWLDEMWRENYMATSRARAFVALREFVRHLVVGGMLGEDVTEGLSAPRKSLHLPRILAESTTLKFVTGVTGGEPRDLRDRAILEIMYACGLRVSEICSVTLEDWAEEEFVIRCVGKGSKERLIPIADAANEALARYVHSARDSFVKNRAVRQIFLTRLGRPFTRVGVFKMVKERAEAAGIDPASVSPHVLRHSFASDLLAHGMDIRSIQELLGHASVATTQIYTHIDSSRLGAAPECCHPGSR